MKTHIPFIILFLLGFSLFAETTDSETTSYDSDIYHFFVGIDLRIPYNDNFYPLLDIAQNKAYIKVNGETVGKPISKLDNFQIKKGTKFSRNFIEVEELSCVPGYSAGADPELRAMQTNMMLNDLSDAAADQYDQSTREVQELSGRMSAGQTGLGEALALAQGRLDSATRAMETLPGQITKGSLGVSQYDVLNVSLRVTASRPMEEPFLVMVARLKDEEDGEVTASWMHFRALGPISTFPSTISFSESSYPDGKFVDAVELFFFSGGNEIATSMSPKRVDLTTEQIRSFANFQYTTQNLSKSLPPVPAWYVLDPSIFRNIDPALLDATLKLTVDKDGIVTQVSTDAKTDSYAITAIRDMMQDLFFYPALDKGTPVEGMVEIKLKDYIL